MAVNSFNPRLFSSTSSENDVDEVFRHKGASVVPSGAIGGLSKSRCFSEPTFQNGKGGKKEDFKLFEKSAALNDSSNVLKRKRGRMFSLDAENLVESDMKSECTTISEETSAFLSAEFDSSEDLPEPENGREAAKMAELYQVEDESVFDVPAFGRETPLDLLEIATETGEENNDVFYVDHVTSGQVISQDGEDDDDVNFPERECLPPGYCSYANDQVPYNPVYPWDLPKCVRRSYEGVDLMPSLPDDLFKESAVYPSMKDCEDCIAPALLPGSFAEPVGFRDHHYY